MTADPAPVRRWPMNCGPNVTKQVSSITPKSTSSSSKVSVSSPCFKAVTSPAHQHRSNPVTGEVPVLVLSDSDGEGEVEDIRSAKRSKTDPSDSSSASFQKGLNDNSTDNKSSMEVENSCNTQSVLVDAADEDDDTVVDPDERWEPQAGVLTKYVEKPQFDWVVVSHKKLNAHGKLPPTVASSDKDKDKFLDVCPLNEAPPGAPIAEEVLDLDGDEEDFFANTQASEEMDNNNTDARRRVLEALEMHEKIRLRLMRDAEDPRRPGDCSSKAGKLMNDNGKWVNRAKRVGPVPGVDVGDIFYFRMAMCIVGLHQQTQAGISTIKGNQNQWGADVACSLVLSGGYEDDKDEGDSFTYTGQGQEDQKLEKGNLGLANSSTYDVPVRVIRGCKDSASPSGTIYSYDGLYKVLRYWQVISATGFNRFMYFLERVPGQRERGSRIVRYSGKLKTQKLARPGLICNDISRGKERIPICAVNECDDSRLPPTGFDYISKVIFPPGFKMPAFPPGCRCTGPCQDSECSCIRKNGGRLPYFLDGTILDWKPIIYECGPNCGCPPSCYNRVSQHGQKRKLEVFKTDNRGWGVRSWEAIPYGSFICEYVGELIDNEEAEKRVGQDEYIFDIDCIRGSRTRGVDISGFFEETVGGELCEQVEEANLSIDAGTCGNISRFINHCCDPNVFVQCVFYDHYDLAIPHIMMFAMKNIRPFEELSYDYGYRLDSVKDASGNIKKKSCYCGSRKCRKRLY